VSSKVHNIKGNNSLAAILIYANFTVLPCFFLYMSMLFLTILEIISAIGISVAFYFILSTRSRPLTSELENCFIDAYSRDEYLCEV